MDPYAEGLARGRPACTKSDVTAIMAAVLDTRRDSRGLDLIHPYTRVVQVNEVHELIGTVEDAMPGGVVRQVTGLGWATITQSGVIMVGDEVWRGSDLVGTIAGFDVSHGDNHINVVVHMGERSLTGREFDLKVGDCLQICTPAQKPGEK